MDIEQRKNASAERVREAINAAKATYQYYEDELTHILPYKASVSPYGMALTYSHLETLITAAKTSINACEVEETEDEQILNKAVENGHIELRIQFGEGCPAFIMAWWVERIPKIGRLRIISEDKK